MDDERGDSTDEIEAMKGGGRETELGRC